MKEGRDQIITELHKLIVGQDDIDQAGAADAVRGRQQPDRRRAGSGEDAPDPYAGARRSISSSRASSSRPDLMPSDITGTDIIQEDTDDRDAGRWCSRPVRSSRTSCSPTRSTARRPRRSPRCSRRCRSTGSRSRAAPTARGAVLRLRDAEPDRARRHVPAARGAARPLHVPHRHRPPAGRGGVRRRAHDDRDPGAGIRATGDAAQDLVAFQRLVRRVPVAEPVMRYALEPRAREPAEIADGARLREEVGGVRRQRPRGAVPGSRRQGPRADAAAATT